MKRCLGKCNTIKVLTEFCRNRRAPDGHGDKCKECMRQYAKDRRQIYASRPRLDPEVVEKCCYGCKRKKLLKEFPKATYRPDGYNIYCKICESARVRAYQKTHPAMIKCYVQTPVYKAKKSMIDHRRRARKVGATLNDFTRQQWEAMKKQYSYRCVYCGMKPKTLTQDHITPIKYGGNHTTSNIVPACRPCNSKKSFGKVPVSIQPVLLLALRCP